MKKTLACMLIVSTLLGGCALGDGEKRYSSTCLDVFDTVTTVVGYADSEGEFSRVSEEIFANLRTYHCLFDIYHDYDGIANLKTVNDHAGVAPVTVDRAIIELLLACKAYYDLTDGKVNVAMGSVLSLWHEATEDAHAAPDHAHLPDEGQLQEAARHTDIEQIVIDEQASTVFIADPDLRIDVGAVAKGWATQKVAQSAPSGLLISVGGNVCATGPKQEPDTPWIVGVQDPDGEGYLKKLSIVGGSVVTSGDYQRYFLVDGVQYHHVIDPQTLMPSNHWRSVTVVCADSALADALSTALFVMPREQGEALLEKVGAEAMWLNADGEIFCSAGMEHYLYTR